MSYEGPHPIPVKSGGTGANTLTGVLIGNGTSPITANPVTQHDLLIGGASNAITSVAPSATSGIPVISQGASADPTFGTAVVAGGGTGATSLTGILTGNGTSAFTANAVTQHGVLIGGASNAASSLGVAATGTVLAGSTGADPAFTATPTVTSITFGSGSALSTNIDWTAWTPTIDGAVSGTTTYSLQNGVYARIGNIVIIEGGMTITSATGTGDARIAGFPFTIKNATGVYARGSVIINGTGWSWPAGATQVLLSGSANSTFFNIATYGSGIANVNLQMTNAACSFTFSIIIPV